MSGPVTAIDGTSLPRARADVATVTLDGEAVIHRHARVHVLDPVATLVWRCCDGEASVDEISAELAEAFATSPGTIRRDVGAVIEDLAALGLLVDADGDANADGTQLQAVLARPELLMDPPGSCASCTERTWAMRRTYRVGARLITVGTDSERGDAAISSALAAHLVEPPEDAETEPPFFAVELHDRVSERGPQQLHLLHRGDTIAARSRRPDQVVWALVGHLASYGDLRALGLAAVNGLVVARGGRAMIVAPPRDPVRFRHALAGEGVLVADLPVALVDPVHGEVVVGAPGLVVDGAAIEALGAESAELEPEPLPWGRYRVMAIGVPGSPSPTAALLALGPAVGDHRDHAGTLDALLALFDSVPVTDAVEPDAIAALLATG